jgi:hypothetical protein
MSDSHPREEDSDSTAAGLIDGSSGSAPLAAIVAPALAFGANIVAGKALASAHRAILGREAPSTKDTQAPIGAVIAWAAVSAAAAAVIQVAVFRAVARVLDD